MGDFARDGERGLGGDKHNNRGGRLYLPALNAFASPQKRTPPCSTEHSRIKVNLIFICVVSSPCTTYLGLVVHEPHEPLDEVVHKAEGARLAPVPVDGDVLAAQGLDDEVAHHTPVCDATGRVRCDGPGRAAQQRARKTKDRDKTKVRGDRDRTSRRRTQAQKHTQHVSLSRRLRALTGAAGGRFFLLPLISRPVLILPYGCIPGP